MLVLVQKVEHVVPVVLAAETAHMLPSRGEGGEE
jgi:hypothetical protein